MNHLFDIKVSAFFFLFTAVSFSNVEIGMKVIVFFLTVGYTARRWYKFERYKKDE